MKSIGSKCGIYLIRNIKNGHFYIGSTKAHFGRWYNHKRALRNNFHTNGRLQRAWNKYGSDSFIFEFVEEFKLEQLQIIEQHLLDRYFGTDICYNLNPYADRWPSSIGRKSSKKTRRRQSWAAKNRKTTIENETIRRKKIGEFNTNKLASKEKKCQISIGKLKAHHKVSTETRAKISNSLKTADCRKYKFTDTYKRDALTMYSTKNYTQKFVADEFGICESYFGRLIKQEKLNGLS